MLTRLRVTSFKAWKDTGELRLAPLTVLFGANSAGKTSIPQLLLLLKQTAESPDRQRALNLGDSRTLVDLGTYEDVLHGHALSQPLTFSLGWRLPSARRIVDGVGGAAFTGDRLSFEATLEAHGKQPRVERMRYTLRQGDAPIADIAMTRTEPGFELESALYPLERQPGRDAPLPSPLRFYGFPDEVAAYYRNAGFTAELVLELERMLRSVHYVGPIREYPRRLYLWSGEVPEHVGVKGERAIEAILAGGARTFAFSPDEPEKTLPEVIAERLRDMGLISSFEARPLGENRKEHEVVVRTSPSLPEVKLTDVGFGVSQVLPVLVECFYVPARSIVIFEQPELHLHPRVQADLADLFIDAIHAREDGAPRECQLIIESHSEHFLRRLQRRIAEEKIAKEDAALYFVGQREGEAQIEELRVDEYGNIQNWPEGFFGDEMEDLVKRSEAQATRMQRGSGE